MPALVGHDCAGCHFQPNTFISWITVTILNMVAILFVANVEGYMLSSAWSEPKIALICKVIYSRANWRVSTFFSITDANSWVPVVWLHPPLVLCQHACNFMFTLTHLARWRFHPQWLSHQQPTSLTQPDKVVPLSHCFHILLLLFGCGKSWVIHKLMWFRLRINMTSSLYIVASVLAIPHWSRCEPFLHHCMCSRSSTYYATSVDPPENFLLWYEPGWDGEKCCC